MIGENGVFSVKNENLLQKIGAKLLNLQFEKKRLPEKAHMNRHKVMIYAIIAVVAMLMAQPAGAFTLVIDAGHGGRDKGAPGLHSYEKDINLAVALALGEMVERNIEGVKVVYTRDRDKYLTLQERCDVANHKKGDLFVSIHTNSLAKTAKNRRTIHGSATYTLGLHRTEENLEVAKRENSVISLEDDYTTTYQGFDPGSTESYIMFELSQDKHLEQSVNFATLVQREFVATAGRVDNGVRQAGFLVLARTSMPAVLVELDFICNPKEEDFLTSKQGRQKMAKALYRAFASYYESLPGVKQPSRVAERGETVTTEGETTYKVQFLTSSKKLGEGAAEFKGLRGVERYRDKGLWKYTYGSAKSEKEALKILKSEVLPRFKQAFIVAFRGGERIR